jgi:tetratricopeptide (TPR) repeat protein
VAARLALLRIDAAEGMGRLEEAAQTLEELGLHPERLAQTTLAGRADEVMERAARLLYRAGRTGRAEEAIARAIDGATRAEARAGREFWRLYLRHGLLTEGATTQVFPTWPGPEFDADLAGVLRGLPGNEHLWPYLLMIGSSAISSGRVDRALDIYRLALSDPAALEAARGDPAVRGGLLVLFPLALEAGRLDEAAWVLETVERLGVAPREEMDALRVRLRAAIADAEAKPPPAGDSEAVSGPPEDGAPAAEPRAIPESPTSPPPERPGVGREIEPPEEDSGPPLLLLSLAAVAALAFALLFRRRTSG